MFRSIYNFLDDTAAVLNISFIHKTGETSDVRNENQTPVVHIFILKLLQDDGKTVNGYCGMGKGYFFYQ
jgi:hypothetical protein